MKYKDLINLSKETVMPDKVSISDSILRTKNRNKFKTAAIVIISILSVIVISTAAYMLLPVSKKNELPYDFNTISPICAVEATKTDGEYITQSSNLIITTQKGMSASEFYNICHISPKIDYIAKRINGNTFKIEFESPLEENTVYNVSSMYNEKAVYKWAFQSSKQLKITSHSPSIDNYDTVTSVNVDFSDTDVSEFEQYFTITPSIPGTFEHYGYRWTFIPSIEFENDTVYTVTVNGAIKSKTGKTLNEDYSFSFVSNQNGNQTYVVYSTSDLSDTFKENEIPVSTIYSDNNSLHQVNVRTFKLKDADEYIALRKKYTQNRIISTNLSNELTDSVKVLDFTATAKQSESNKNIYYLYYPQSFEEGFYVSEITKDNLVIYHIYQISNLSVYAYENNDNYVVWVHDLKTSQPAVAANVSLEDNSRLTDTNGIAEFNDCKIEDYYSYFKIKFSNAHQHVISLNTSVDTDKNSSLGYLFTDKTQYTHSDCVKLCGFTQFTASNVENQTKINLFCNWNNQFIELSPDETGYFTAEIPLNECFDESPIISLYINSEKVASTSFDIIVNNQTYICSVITDKPYYFVDEPINYTLYITDSGGNPAANVTVSVDGESLTTDENGKVTYQSPAKAEFIEDNIEEHSKEFIINEVTAKTHSVFILQSSLFIDASIDSEQFLNVSLLAFEPNRFSSGIVSKSSNQFKHAMTLTNGDIEVKVYKKIYTRDTENPIYDPLNDKTFYNYTYKNEIVYEGNFAVSNGSISIPLNEISASDIQSDYYIEIFSKDAHTIVKHGDGVPNNTHYSLSTTPYLQLNDCKTDAPVTDGSMLIVSSNNSNFHSERIEFTNDNAPKYTKYNISSGAYFDGHDIHTLSFTNEYQVDIDDSLSISTDKNIYNCGDTVNLKLSTKADTDISYMNIKVSDSPKQIAASLNPNNIVEVSSSYTPYRDRIKPDDIDIKSAEESANTVYFENVKTDTKEISFIIPQKADSYYIDIIVLLNGSLIEKTFKLNVGIRDEIQSHEKDIITSDCEYSYFDYEITEKTKLDADLYVDDANIHLYSSDMAMYFSALEKLHSSNTDNLLSKIGKSISESVLLNEDFGVLNFENAENVYKLLCSDNSEYTYEDTVKLCSIAHNYLNKQQLTDYFYEIVNTNPSNQTSLSAYYILAKLGEPVLDSIKNISNTSTQLETTELLYIALTLAECGDYTSARELYDNSVASHFKISNDMSFYNGDTPELSDSLTLLSSSLASKVSPNDAKSLIKYILNNNEIQVFSTVQLLDYIENYTPQVNNKSTVNIYYNDTQHKVIIPENTSYHITLTKEECASAFFESITGDTRIFTFVKSTQK